MMASLRVQYQGLGRGNYQNVNGDMISGTEEGGTQIRIQYQGWGEGGQKMQN